MKTFYQNNNLIKVADIRLLECLDSPELIISKNSIKLPYTTLRFTDTSTITLYAPQICEVSSRFKNDYETCLNCYRDNDKNGFNVIDDIRLDSLGMLILDTLEAERGFMILNIKKQHLRLSEISLQGSYLEKQGKEYLIESGVCKQIISALGYDYTFKPSGSLLSRLWDFINDVSELNQDLESGLFAFGKIDFREEEKPLEIFNQKLKKALLFEICKYFADNGDL